MIRWLYPLLILFLFGSPAFSWHVNTHLQMIRDAVALMPPDFQKTFREHQAFVESGIKDPDELIKDWSNHYYLPGANEGGAITRIDQIIGVVQMKFKNSNLTDVSKQLCYLGHYIGDLWTPSYLIKGSTTPDMDYAKNNDIYVFWEGYSKPIDNLHDYFMKRAMWRWRLENDKKINPLLYSEAVNDIARTWLTLWQQSGRALEPIKASVIEHKAGTLTVNFARMLFDEEVNYYDDWEYSDTWEDSWDKYGDHLSEERRLYEQVNPSESTLVAQAQFRTEQQLLNANNPSAPFKMLESSMVSIGDKSYFVARVRNNGQEEIGSLAFMYPGVRGPIGMIRNLRPGEIAKIDTIIAGKANKDQIQLIYSAAQQAQKQ